MARKPEPAATGSVRMGPISIFTLVIVICLAVMATLALTTARADAALAERQASFTSDDYANERLGQAFLAEADATLASARATGLGPAEAASALAGELDSLTARAADAAAANGHTLQAQANGNAISVRIDAPSGRTLAIGLAVTDDGGLAISYWKPSTTWTEDTSDTLWMGA